MQRQLCAKLAAVSPLLQHPNQLRLHPMTSLTRYCRDLTVVASQSSPSYKPSPLIAIALCTCHRLLRSSGNPRASHTSVGLAQPRMSWTINSTALQDKSDNVVPQQRWQPQKAEGPRFKGRNAETMKQYSTCSDIEALKASVGVADLCISCQLKSSSTARCFNRQKATGRIKPVNAAGSHKYTGFGRACLWHPTAVVC